MKMIRRVRRATHGLLLDKRLDVHELLDQLLIFPHGCEEKSFLFTRRGKSTKNNSLSADLSFVRAVHQPVHLRRRCCVHCHCSSPSPSHSIQCSPGGEPELICLPMLHFNDKQSIDHRSLMKGELASHFLGIDRNTSLRSLRQQRSQHDESLPLRREISSPWPMATSSSFSARRMTNRGLSRSRRMTKRLDELEQEMELLDGKIVLLVVVGSVVPRMESHRPCRVN